MYTVTGGVSILSDLFQIGQVDVSVGPKLHYPEEEMQLRSNHTVRHTIVFFLPI